MASPASSKKGRWAGKGPLIRYGLICAGACFLLAGCIYASQAFEQYVIRDPRFILPGEPDYGLESPNLELSGTKYASRANILKLFEPDFGRSLYLFPMADRRRQLSGIRWVRDASIVREWPNRVAVRIIERQPAAFVKVAAESMSRWALIDDEGVILDAPAKASFRLPVLTGVRLSESAEIRGRRVRRMQRLMKDLGALSNGVSEVDAGDLDNLRITEQAEGTAVTLLLGDRNFASRLQNFLEHYPDIHRRMPQAASFDLRLDDRITGLETNDVR